MQHHELRMPCCEFSRECFGTFVAVDEYDHPLGFERLEQLVQDSGFVVIARFGVAVLGRGDCPRQAIDSQCLCHSGNTLQQHVPITKQRQQ